MSVEVSVYAAGAPVTWPEVRETGLQKGLELRLLNEDGRPLGTDPPDPLEGGFVVVGWPKPFTETTVEIDKAIEANDKETIDRLGREHRIAWCSLRACRFDYDRFWAEHRSERKDFEASVAADQLARIRDASVRYSLRSGTRPPPNARLVGYLSRWLAALTSGVIAEG